MFFCEIVVIVFSSLRNEPKKEITAKKEKKNGLGPRAAELRGPLSVAPPAKVVVEEAAVECRGQAWGEG